VIVTSGAALGVALGVELGVTADGSDEGDDSGAEGMGGLEEQAAKEATSASRQTGRVIGRSSRWMGEERS
jgi:hypothetical protein